MYYYTEIVSIVGMCLYNLLFEQKFEGSGIKTSISNLGTFHILPTFIISFQ